MVFVFFQESRGHIWRISTHRKCLRFYTQFYHVGRDLDEKLELLSGRLGQGAPGLTFQSEHTQTTTRASSGMLGSEGHSGL